MHNNINVNVSGPKKDYTSTYKTYILRGNMSFADQVTEPNVKYVIKYDFDLDCGTVTIPEGCLLEFDGGSVSNGTIEFDNTILVYNQQEEDVLKNITIIGDYEVSAGGKGDKKDNINGMGKIYLKKNKGFAEQLTQDNTIYVIQYDFDLGEEEVTIPENCVLEFDGGSIKNGVLVGNYRNSVLDVTNFGLVGDAETDNSAAFINMLKGITTSSNYAHHVLYFPKGDYIFKSNNIFGSFSSTSVLGMTVKGDSRMLTSLVLDTSDEQEKWLYENCSNGKLQSLEFEDITLMTTDPTYGNGLKLTSTGLEKQPKFTNCGLFLGTVLQCEGTANADLSIIDNCTISALKVLVLNNYQSVTHRITNCNITFVYNVVYSTKGGCVYIGNCNIENYNWWRRQGYNQGVSVYKTIYNDDEVEPIHPIIYSVGGSTVGNSSININNSRFEIHNTGSFVYAGNKCNVSFCGCECGTYASQKYASYIRDKAVVKFIDNVFCSTVIFSINNINFATNDTGPMLFIDRCSLDKHGNDDIVTLLDNNDTAISVNFYTAIYCSVKVSNCYNNITGTDGNNYRIQDFDITGKSRSVFHSGINRKCVYPDTVSQNAYATSGQGTLVCKLPKYNTFVGFDIYLSGNTTTTEYYYVVGIGFDDSETIIFKTDYFKLSSTPTTLHYDSFNPYKYKAIHLKRKGLGGSGQQSSSSMVVYYI